MAKRILILAVAVSALLSGCVPDQLILPTPTASPAPSASPSESPLPSPSPSRSTPAPTAPAVSCESVLDEGSREVFATMGFTQSDDFTERMVAEQNPIARFATYGGLLCQWGVPRTDASEVYAFSPLTPGQADAERARIESEGFTATGTGRGLFSRTSESLTEYYLFTATHWYYAWGEERIDEIRVNVEASEG